MARAAEVANRTRDARAIEREFDACDSEIAELWDLRAQTLPREHRLRNKG
jgi:hypothetical protein